LIDVQGRAPTRHLPSKEVSVPSGLLTFDRSSCFGGVGYSPARMVVADPPRGREAVLEKIRTRILGAARRGLSPSDAEDLTQEALLLLSTKYAHVAAPEELVALGVKIVRLKRTALWRKAARRRAAGESPLPSHEEEDRDPLENVTGGGPDPEEVAVTRERLRVLARAASRLDGRCREILRRKLEGQSFVEIAADLGRNVNTVYSWDHRCHKRLKKLLGEHLGFVSGEEGRP
jgi:RNA polymerase sigma factor (sigma-70 family)